MVLLRDSTVTSEPNEGKMSHDQLCASQPVKEPSITSANSCFCMVVGGLRLMILFRFTIIKKGEARSLLIKEKVFNRDCLVTVPTTLDTNMLFDCYSRHNSGLINRKSGFKDPQSFFAKGSRNPSAP